eukprot:6193922-Pleurochrysis_carterae.AAC.4
MISPTRNSANTQQAALSGAFNNLALRLNKIIAKTASKGNHQTIGNLPAKIAIFTSSHSIRESQCDLISEVRLRRQRRTRPSKPTSV